MAENLEIAAGDKSDKYDLLLRQVKVFAEYENDHIALLANVACMIHHTFGFLWTGFYRIINSELILGPFQGPLACSRIPFGKGVCGTAWKEGRTLIVKDVDEFPGHIACSSDSRSEIVVPLMSGADVVAVLDIDSADYATFDDTDAIWLERIAAVVASTMNH